MSNEGKKFDTDKLRWDLLPMGALEEVAKVYSFGSVKYDAWNWRKGLSFSRCAAAFMRHWFAWWWRGETHDQESGCHHLASCTFYLLNFMTYQQDGRKDLDDRPTATQPPQSRASACTLQSPCVPHPAPAPASPSCSTD